MKTIYELYGYYKKYIEVIGRKPFSDNPKMNDIGITKAAMQQAYKEMKELRFPGSVVDYMIWVGGMFMFELWLRRSEEPELLFEELAKERPGDAAVMIRSAHIIRVTDIRLMYPLPPDILHVFVSDTMETAEEVARLAIVGGLAEEVEKGGKARDTAWLQLKKLKHENAIKRIFEYQQVASVPGASPSQPQPQPPTKQTTKTSLSGTRRTKAAKRSGAAS